MKETYKIPRQRMGEPVLTSISLYRKTKFCSLTFRRRTPNSAKDFAEYFKLVHVNNIVLQENLPDGRREIHVEGELCFLAYGAYSLIKQFILVSMFDNECDLHINQEELDQ